MVHCAKLKILRHIDKRYLICGAFTVFLLDFFGIFSKLLERDYDASFRYPYDVNVTSLVDKLRRGLQPDVTPINVYNFDYMHVNGEKCKGGDRLRLVYIVKSSVDHFERRQVIRRTWGFEKRFSDVPIRRIFVLGNAHNDQIQSLVNVEIEKYKDIVQINFRDSYYNNTLKTMCAIKWVTEHCPHSRFYFFSDDDMYVSTKNVLRFLRNPTNYPDYIQLPPSMLGSDSDRGPPGTKTDSNLVKNNIRLTYNYDLPEGTILYSGFVFVSSPHRHKSSKWYVSLKEYPYDQWPPYVTAGAYALSREALFKLYYTSFYTKHFKFDDIFLGLVAMKAGIEPFHCDQFYFYKKPYNSFNYRYVIASHGYDDVNELERVWNEQREAGNA